MYIYVLRLDNNKYYIGKTNNKNFRLNQHFDIDGAAWTKKYKPIDVIELIPNCDHLDEDKYTLKYMKKYGISNVRGGSFCRIKLSRENISTIQQMIKGSSDKCYYCNKVGHFINDCDKKNNDSKNNNESDSDSGSDSDDDFVLCNIIRGNFLSNCYTLDNKKTGKLDTNSILFALKNSYDEFNSLNLMNIRNICQKINCCMEPDHIPRKTELSLNYTDFIDGFIYILRYDPEVCYGCNIEGHTDSNCPVYHNEIYVSDDDEYNTSDSNDENDPLNSDNEYDDYLDPDNEGFSWRCEYCDKEFDSKKGMLFHVNIYCNKKKKLKGNIKYQYNDKYSKNNKVYRKNKQITISDKCYRCGRKGHYVVDCFATKHVDGYYLS